VHSAAAVVAGCEGNEITDEYLLAPSSDALRYSPCVSVAVYLGNEVASTVFILAPSTFCKLSICRPTSV